MDRKILFLDLDGTLLNDQKEITPGNRSAIEKAIALGHQVVVTSGRPLKSALVQAERLGLTGEGCHVIAYNGAVIYDCHRQREIFRRTLHMADLYQLFDEARRRNIHIQAYDGDDTVVIESCCDTAVAGRYCAKIDLHFRVVEDIRTGLTGASVKALMIDFQDHEPVAAMEQWVLENMAGKVDCFFSSRYYLEVVPVDMNKGEAVREMCKILGTPLENTVAAGDEANDVSMIQTAGTGVAMDNAVQAAKDAADYVTQRDNNHDGIAEVIERFLL